MTILLEKNEYSEYHDILKDLTSLPSGRTNYNWISTSGILRQVKRTVQKRNQPEVAAASEALLKKWTDEALKEGIDDQLRVASWVTEQSKVKKRPIIMYKDEPHELGNNQVSKMIQCPLYKDYYKTSTDPVDTQKVSSEEVDQYMTIDGRWVLDELLGECFHLTNKDSSKEPSTATPPHPTAHVQPPQPQQMYPPPPAGYYPYYAPPYPYQPYPYPVHPQIAPQ
eukprot:TRINITY_DN43250_c0_g1_i1.p1 TRINITY_DN43250_c0_g1~~TRINITY_DN43250_c0_g1_i1.p1  ORF type:complete len:240 (+),score=28.23 TRINITY_DN43250_c0_g1_i1:50-721(+)